MLSIANIYRIRRQHVKLSLKHIKNHIKLPKMDIESKVMFLAWPAILENFLTTLIQFVNTAMVSRLGKEETAAVGINTPLIWLVNSIVIAAGVGATALVARYIGAGENNRADNAAKQSLLIGFILGLVITVSVLLLSGWLPQWMGAGSTVAPLAAAYLRILSSTFILYFTGLILSAVLRGAGETKLPMKVNVLINIVNVIGNFFLIYPSRSIIIPAKLKLYVWGAGMGVSGAAASSAFSEGLAGVILLFVLFRGQYNIKLKIKELLIVDFDVIKKILNIGIPAAGEKAVISLGQIVFTRLIAGIGTVQLAAHYLANTAESISYMPVNGIAVAATALVGQWLGKKDESTAEKYGYASFRIGLVVMFCMMGVFLVFPQYLLAIFTGDSEVIWQGASVLRIEAFSQPFFASAIILTGALRGAGDTRYPLGVAVFGMWIVRLSVAWFLVTKLSMGLKGAWIAMVMDLAIRGILIFIRYRRGKWKSIVVD